MKYCILVSLCLFSFCTLHAAETRPPNVLLIISDDQGWEDFSFMGHPQVSTPNLDKLAARSLTFTRGYSPVPLCRPSLASIATGLYPFQHGVTGNDPALPDKGANAMAGRTNPKYDHYYKTIIGNFSKRPNMIRDLTSHGYSSFQTGKWWEGDPVKSAGFSHAMTAGEGKGDRHGGAGLEIGRNGLDPIFQFIEQTGGKPWLVWYAPMLPHDPHNPPDDLLQKYLKVAPSESVARYWGNVEWFDRTCGDLLAHLEKIGQLDNTIVLFTTDNGYIPDPNKKRGPAPRSKLTPYEGGVRTPIMVAWPGKIAPRMDREHLATNLDLWPTLAALLKLPLPSDLPGINLTDETAVAARHIIFGEQYPHNVADVDNPTAGIETRWVIDGWWKLIAPDPINMNGAKAELYDLKNDPWEKVDLADKEPARAAELLKKINAWWKEPNK
ncbi:MAG: sulfatase [Verrucomicrobiaceae bacterium]|nr:MAG: sulfatase [Verrucomicrobiaceae bacterium]